MRCIFLKCTALNNSCIYKPKSPPHKRIHPPVSFRTCLSSVPQICLSASLPLPPQTPPWPQIPQQEAWRAGAATKSPPAPPQPGSTEGSGWISLSFPWTPWLWKRRIFQHYLPNCPYLWPIPQVLREGHRNVLGRWWPPARVFEVSTTVLAIFYIRIKSKTPVLVCLILGNIYIYMVIASLSLIMRIKVYFLCCFTIMLARIYSFVWVF